MTSPSRKVVRIFRIKFPTKRIFRIFPILRTDAKVDGPKFWNLFMERPSYNKKVDGPKFADPSVAAVSSWFKKSMSHDLSWCISFVTIPVWDRQTDRQTDGRALQHWLSCSALKTLATTQCMANYSQLSWCNNIHWQIITWELLDNVFSSN